MREAIGEISRNVDWLERQLADAETRRDEARKRGYELAACLRHYLQNPGAIGTDALNAAYGRYMAAHSANFWPSTAQVG